MERVSIKGKNENIKICLECGKSLTFNEYGDCQIMCSGCRVKFLSRNIGKYIAKDGSNNIDEILMNKKERN